MNPALAEALRLRIDKLNEGNERLYRLDFIGRAWLADFAADAVWLADYVERTLKESEQ